MSWQDVADTVTGRYDAGAKTLDIQSHHFPSRAMQALFGGSLKVAGLQLQRVDKLETKGEAIVARGVIAGFPVGLAKKEVEVSATAVFSFADGEPRLALAFGVPDQDPTWTLNDYFPPLKQTALNTVKTTGTPLFVYASADHIDRLIHDNEAPVTLKAGLNFHGIVAPDNALFNKISGIAGKFTDVTMTGPLAFDTERRPNFNLVLERDSGFGDLFGPMKPAVSMAMTSDFSPAGNDSKAGVRIGMQIHAQMIQAIVTDKSGDVLKLQGSFKDVPLPSVTDIIRLAG